MGLTSKFVKNKLNNLITGEILKLFSSVTKNVASNHNEPAQHIGFL